ncbi:hypothetical protein V498_06769 [Pseudogymnoascus sp. VKM F-4517 (FW-2822)]|nr:hypothetical protein V498_06769 [Pseudogymnoascus sp. VKM F-4517 (FW-2822)]
MRLDHDSASEPSDNGTRYTPGDLLLRTASYATASIMSARTIRLRYNREQNLTLGDLLLTLMRPGVQLFGFITKGGPRQMCSAGYVSPEIIDTTPVTTALHVRDAFSALGMRFSVDPLGQGSACPIDRGGFEQYSRIEREYMPYDGTQAAVNLAHQLNR